jgi:hypothetical protein
MNTEQFNKLQEFSTLKVVSLYSNAGGIKTIGMDGVKAIWEHPAGGEGDKWYYAIEYDDEYKKVDYIFNPESVTKEKL